MKKREQSYRGWLRNRRPDETSLRIRMSTRESCSDKCKVLVGRSHGFIAVVQGLKHSKTCDRKYKIAYKIKHL